MPTRPLITHVVTDTRCSLGREQNSGHNRGLSFHTAYTGSCQWCLLSLPTCGDVVSCQL